MATARGTGTRCHGFVSSDGTVVFCSREEHAHGIEPSATTGLYPHRLAGPCPCREPHGKPHTERRTDYSIPLPRGGVAEHVRIDRADGKRVYWRLDGKNGLQGLRVQDIPLYGHEHLANVPVGAIVVVTEGEKATDELRRAGVLAVGTVTGAGALPSDEVLRVLVGFDVVLWPDNDEPGQGHMRRIADRLETMGVTPRIVRDPEALPGEDAADLAERGEADRIRTLIAAARSSSSIQFRRFDDFVADGGAEVPWLVDGLVARGAITLLSGQPKESGKTTLVLALVHSVLDGGRFLGRRVLGGPVIYLTEEGASTFGRACRGAGIVCADDLWVLSYSDVAMQEWAEIAAATLAFAEGIGARLVVVDTLPQWSGLDGELENNAGDALRVIAPLLRARSLDLAVIAVNHRRKAGGSISEAGRGSSAIAGAVDVLMALHGPKQGMGPNQRTLESLGRFSEIPRELVVERIGTEFHELGTPEQARGEEITRRILAALDNPATLEELVERLGGRPGRTSLQPRLTALVERGVLVAEGAGRKNDPRKYVRANASAVLGDLSSAESSSGGVQ